MMVIDETTPIVIEAAQIFILLLRELDPGWLKGYFRFQRHEQTSEANGSFSTVDGAKLINSIKNGGTIRRLSDASSHLLNLLEKPNGVVLLIVESNLDYEIKFEYINLDRWRITRLDGGTGIPKDL